MTQISNTGQFASGAQAKRGAPMDVYTGLLLAALVVLLTGFISIISANNRLAEGETSAGGMLDSIPGFKIIEK
ncbi:MAG: hypothetical protein MK082_09315 [Phycisphaerales bacterium]|nr:hypothetical protein [Phycisphaerales bacterium]